MAHFDEPEEVTDSIMNIPLSPNGESSLICVKGSRKNCTAGVNEIFRQPETTLDPHLFGLPKVRQSVIDSESDTVECLQFTIV